MDKYEQYLEKRAEAERNTYEDIRNRRIVFSTEEERLLKMHSVSERLRYALSDLSEYRKSRPADSSDSG